MGRVPFSTYMLVSCPVVWVLSGGVIIFGDSLATGSAAKLVFGVMFVIAVLLITHFVRKRVAQRRPAVVAEVAGEPVAAPPDAGSSS
jgi:hypothetical protein